MKIKYTGITHHYLKKGTVYDVNLDLAELRVTEVKGANFEYSFKYYSMESLKNDWKIPIQEIKAEEIIDEMARRVKNILELHMCEAFHIDVDLIAKRMKAEIKESEQSECKVIPGTSRKD